MAKPSKSETVRSFAERFARIRAAVLVTDTLLQAHFDRTARDIEAFNAALQPMLEPATTDTPATN